MILTDYVLFMLRNTVGFTIIIIIIIIESFVLRILKYPMRYNISTIYSLSKERLDFKLKTLQ